MYQQTRTFAECVKIGRYPYMSHNRTLKYMDNNTEKGVGTLIKFIIVQTLLPSAP